MQAQEVVSVTTEGLVLLGCLILGTPGAPSRGIRVCSWSAVATCVFRRFGATDVNCYMRLNPTRTFVAHEEDTG